MNFVVVRVILPELFLKPVLQFQFCQHQEFAKIKPETIYKFIWKLLTISKKKKIRMKKERQLLLLITMAILNPNPGSPSRFSLGILQSSKIRLQVEVALIPSLSSFFPRDRPAMGLGTRNALIPWDRKKSVKYTDQMTCYSYIDFIKWDNFVLALCFWLLSVVAKTYKYDIKVMYKCRQQTDNLTPDKATLVCLWHINPPIRIRSI